MGLLNLIPPDNKLGQILMGLQQPLNDLGVGLQRGKTWQKGIREASKYTEEQAPLRAEQAQLQLKTLNDANTRNSTAAYLRAQPGGAQFADAIESGAIDGSTAFKSWLDASKGQAPQNPYMSAGDGQFFNWQTGEYVTNPNAVPDTPNLPNSYQEFLLAQQDPAYAATLSSSSSKPPTEGERRNQQLATVIAPELATVEANWKALTDGKDQIVGGDMGGNRPGLAFTSPEYQQAINSLSTIVASYLYSVSGATATDEEIKRQVSLLTPKLGESEQSANAKLDRIRTYAKAVTEAAGRAGNQPVVSADPDVDAILQQYGVP